ncbi:MAG: aminoacyl-tRNA hydrolase [Rhodospirillaceae bacterium]
MYLLVGLGNPGSGYANNRHNLGYRTIDAIAKQHGFGPWRDKFHGQITEGRLGSNKVILLKPTTFMNESGRSLGAVIKFHKLDLDDVIVFLDEIELAPGKIRVKKGGGHAGHNGIRSLISHIGLDFWRVRMGVGHPGHKDRVSGYVLQDFSKTDQSWLDTLVDATAVSAALLVEGNHNRFMTDVSQAMTGLTLPTSPRDAISTD